MQERREREKGERERIKESEITFKIDTRDTYPEVETRAEEVSSCVMSCKEMGKEKNR